MDAFHRNQQEHHIGGCGRWKCRMCGPDRDTRVAMKRAARRRMRRELATTDER